MSQNYRYTLHATVRDDTGKGASRRLRQRGLVPAIVYGGDEEPLSIAIKQDELLKNTRFDSFYSQIINLKIDGREDLEILVRDVQRHLFKPLFQHFDFQRIVRGQELQATVALHFINETTCPGVKAGGVASHLLSAVDIICRPRHLPENIIVDMAKAEIGTIINLNDLVLPEGVRLHQEEDLDTTTVAQIIHARVADDDETSGAGADDSESGNNE